MERTETQQLIQKMRRMPHCSVIRPTDQTIGNTTNVAVDFTASATVTDTHEMFATASSSILTVQLPGLYLLEGYVYWAQDADGTRLLWIEVDDAMVVATRTPATDTLYYQNVACTASLTAGQVIDMWVRHNAGADLVLTAGNNAPRLAATWLRPTQIGRAHV